MSKFNIPKPGVYTILFVIVTVLVLITMNRGTDQQPPDYRISTVEPFHFEVIDSLEHAEYLEYTVKVTNIADQPVSYAKTYMIVGNIHEKDIMESYYEKIGKDYSALAPDESVIIGYKIEGIPAEIVRSYRFESEDISYN